MGTILQALVVISLQNCIFGLLATTEKIAKVVEISCD